METYYENAHRRSDLGHAHFRPRFHPAHPTVAAAPISRDKTTMVTTAGTLWRSGTGLTAGKLQSAATRRSERRSIHARWHAPIHTTSNKKMCHEATIAALALVTLIAVPRGFLSAHRYGRRWKRT